MTSKKKKSVKKNDHVKFVSGATCSFYLKEQMLWNKNMWFVFPILPHISLSFPTPKLPQVIRFVQGIRFFKSKNPSRYSFSASVKQSDYKMPPVPDSTRANST